MTFYEENFNFYFLFFYFSFLTRRWARAFYYALLRQRPKIDVKAQNCGVQGMFNPVFNFFDQNFCFFGSKVLNRGTV